MSDLTPFEFEYSGQQIRTTTIEGEPWFAAHDMCNILGYLNARDAVARHVPAQLKGVSRFPTPLSSSGFADLTVINEAGLYRLIMRSNATGAAPFQAWVTEEVLPSIRKTGSYGAVTPALPKSYAEALRELAATVEERDIAKAEVVELRPKAESWDVLADTGADYSVRDASYILNRDPNINTGQRRLFALLREWRLVDRGDRPYANHATHVTLRPRSRPDSAGEQVPARPQVRVTVAGLSYLHKRLGGVAPLDFTEVAS